MVVHDGPTAAAAELGHLSGSQLSHYSSHYSSHGSEMTLKFQSDDDSGTAGFEATYTCGPQGVPEPEPEPEPEHDSLKVHADGVPHDSSIDQPGDKVWFSFVAVAGMTYQVDTELNTLRDTDMQLHGPSHMPLAHNDDDERQTGRLDSYLEWTCPEDGTYEVEIGGGRDRQTGTFSLTIVEAITGGGDPCSSEGARMTEDGADISFTAHDYGDNADCTWIVECGSASDVVSISFEAFDTEAEFDTLAIHDGDVHADSLTGARPLSGELADLQRTTFVSTGHSVTLHFVSDASTNAGGFEGTYSCQMAGGAFPGGGVTVCEDDADHILTSTIGMDCAAAMEAIPTTPHFTGDVCDFSLETWLGADVAVRDMCPVSCGVCTVDMCNPSPCENGGACSVAGFPVASAQCACVDGYTGDQCEVAPPVVTDPCTPNPCDNGGSCTVVVFPFEHTMCSCVFGFSGDLCEVAPDVCEDDAEGTLASSLGMDCGAAMAAIPGTPGYAGEVCNFDLTTWLNEDVTVAQLCPRSCETCTPPPEFVEVIPDGAVHHAEVVSINEEIFFQFTAEEGHSYQMETEMETDGLEDTIMILYESDGVTPIHENDDDFRVTGQQDSFIEWDCARSGEYFVMVKGADRNIGAFTMVVSEVVASGPSPPHAENTCEEHAHCLNEGECRTFETVVFGVTSEQNICMCEDGLSGEHCECDSSVLGAVHGECNALSDSCDEWACVCSQGWRSSDEANGHFCDVSSSHEHGSNGCETHPCQHGGVCSSFLLMGTQTVECECRPNFGGAFCENQDTIDHCANPDGHAPCENQGTCIDLFGEYKCECSPGYGGAHCEHHDTINDCESGDPCNGHGSCSDSFFGYECACASGWGGHQCDEDESTMTDPCSSNPCLHGGSCMSEWFGQDYGYTCQCAETTYGNHCEHEDAVDQCDQIECCATGGSCVDIFNDAICECHAGYSGSSCGVGPLGAVVPGCSGGEVIAPPPPTPVADTPCSPNPCDHGGACGDVTFPRPHAVCSCIHGYSGLMCDTDPVHHSPCSPSPCANDGVCSEVSFPSPHAVCACVGEWTGVDCAEQVRVDVCATVFCMNSGSCEVVGVFNEAPQCVCVGGYTGQVCETPPVSADVCQPDPCQHGGACSVVRFPTTRAACDCSGTGYDGDHCEMASAPDACAGVTCQNGGACLVETVFGEVHSGCECASGFSGATCETFDGLADPCNPSPCMHGGSCRAVAFPAPGAQCDCIIGYTGDSCETAPAPVDPCSPNPCANGGRCEHVSFPMDHTVCECASGFSGATCETADVVDPCHPSPCMHGGHCSAASFPASGTTCTCQNGYSGAECETRPVAHPLCEGVTCQNGGSCEVEGVFTPAAECVCVGGFSGGRCETAQMDPCDIVTCLNGGTCEVQTLFGEINFGCVCEAGFSGDLCETAPAPADPCSPNPCANGGRCEHVTFPMDHTVCECASGFSGATCETADVVDPCNPSPCMHGGACRAASFPASGASCACVGGFSGDLCETAAPADFCAMHCGSGGH